MDSAFWIGFVNIIIIDIVLSGDNAVVIGMASRRLPKGDRKKAVLWGTLGAVFLRFVLTGLATWFLLVPYLKAIGGFMLAWISFKLLTGEGENASDIRAAATLGSAVKTIIVADFIMSLDNVLAVGGAAHGNFLLVILGLGLSIPLLMVGSNTIADLMDRLPSLVYIGAAVLSYTSGTMVMSEEMVQQYILPSYAYLDWLVPLFFVVFILLFSRWWRHHIESFY
ncbi:TerC family protein [Aneurinibacillus sp. Ricciae_BoGa-3]|uniref:TerC family protein n=1 Tax=Aneurinibacillus sp. Ricciae_BoGa-3 TaxID=3022697 RepID=UPI00234124DB|nr:TerC family protein [Aneurinibacillus sp. Ricciae_BoGa-3]WCK55831.1 TerC family protein [Aneurinibacillus sp. Ricciae_BoGa-3]